jgi:hypothetical protein
MEGGPGTDTRTSVVETNRSNDANRRINPVKLSSFDPSADASEQLTIAIDGFFLQAL